MVAALALSITSCSSAETSLRANADAPVDAVAVADGEVAADAGPATESALVGDGPRPLSAGAAEAATDKMTIPVQPAPSLESVQRERRAAAAEAQPVGLTIEALAIEAPIRPVGVEPNGEMEIPGASEVGWYRFGSRPGDEGSAVLAAHVDFNGRIGVFYELASGQVGDTIEVAFSDGTSRSFVVTARNQYEKASLPFDEIFRREGAPSLVLITCGGDFNPSLRSYEDNVVLFAEPNGE